MKSEMVIIVMLIGVLLGISIFGSTVIFQTAMHQQEVVVVGELQEQTDQKKTLADVRRVLQRRVDITGQRGFEVRELENGQLEFRFPNSNTDEVERIWATLTRPGKLEFRILADQNQHPGLIDAARETADQKQAIVFDEEQTKPIGRWVTLARDGKADDSAMERRQQQFKFVPHETHLLRDKDSGEIISSKDRKFDGPDRRQKFTDWCSGNGYLDIEILVAEPSKERQKVDSSFLTSVKMGFDRDLGPRLEFKLNSQGAKRMFSLTSRNKPVEGRYSLMGIVLDDQLLSAPRINEPIRSSSIIEGEFSEAEINELISILSSGTLSVPLQPDWISIQEIKPKSDK